MEFTNEQHRTTHERVTRYVTELFEDVFHDQKSGHLYVRYGSTVLEVSVDPYGPDDAMVILMSYCVQGIELEDELLLGLLELNHTLPFGAFSLVGRDIYFSASLLGRTLERANLLAVIAEVANISDEYDDRIVAKYGGQRALDRIRDTGGRQQRSKALRQ